MMARVDGVGFSGPPAMVAKAFQTCFYPLMFRPQFEGPVQVCEVMKSLKFLLQKCHHILITCFACISIVENTALETI